MNQETQTPNPNNEYEIGTSFEFVEQEPATLDVARELILSGLNRAKEHAALQTRMMVYDAIHGTHYRRIRKQVMAEQRNKRFEESIGLERV